MDPNTVFQSNKDSNKSIDIMYASLIGSINYCAISTCPDISFTTNKCAQFNSLPTLIHWEASKRIFCYLIHTKDYGITYSQEGNGIEGYAHNLEGYTDTDFAGDANDCKSTTGWVFTFNGTPISWASKKQVL